MISLLPHISIRALAVSGFSGVILWVFQTFNFEAIADKYGVPLALSVLMFLYFSRAMAKQGKDVDEYRAQTLIEAQKSNAFLQKLLAETKLQNVCNYKQQGK